MEIIIKILLNATAVILSSYILPGVRVDTFLQAVIAAIALGIVNTFVKPILIFLTLPATIVTLGLFLLVINAALVMLVARFIPGFHISNFWWALAFSFVFSALKFILEAIFGIK